MPRQCIRVLNRHARSETWIERLREAGYDVDARPIRAPGDLKALGKNVPAAVAIDLASAPAHGRDLGLAVRQLKTTRQVPLFIVEGGPQQVEQLRSLLPEAVTLRRRGEGPRDLTIWLTRRLRARRPYAPECHQDRRGAGPADLCRPARG